jgi:type I restriction enzyme M protein
MAKSRNNARATKSNGGATVGYEAQLWQMADALRGSMDAAEYKHVVLGLIFLKYISDAFEEQHAKLVAEKSKGADPEDPDEYRAQSIFWVPPEARWAHLKAQARQATVGQLVDDAMAGIERDNPALKGVLPRDYARPALDKTRLGQLIDLISNIKVGDEASRAKDVLGRVYEYFLSQFASAEGKKGGEFYTPRCVVKLLVEMLEPYRGRVYDPCCGSSGMFVQSVEFIRAHAKGNGNGGKAKADISIYGQESNYTTWRLAKMNLAIRGIDGQIAHGDTFHNDRHPDLKADFILANPPFNVSDWAGERLRDDKRWRYGVPPAGNANFAWMQHIVHHLAPARGRLRARQRLDVVQPVRGGGDPEEPDRGRRGRLHDRATGSALLFDADSRVPLVPGARPQERQVPRPSRPRALHRRPQARPHGGPHPPGAHRRGHRPHRQNLSCLAR